MAEFKNILLAVSLLVVTFGVWLPDAYKNYFESYPTVAPSNVSAVVISGCSSGIGYHLSFYLANKGFRVYAGVRKMDDFNKFDDNDLIVPVILDVANSTTVQLATETIARDLNQSRRFLTGLINNAGIGYMSTIEEMELGYFKGVMDVNVYGVIEMTQRFLPLLRAHGHSSRIINIGSIAGFMATPLRGPYTASKFALEAITDTLRQELDVSYQLHRKNGDENADGVYRQSTSQIPASEGGGGVDLPRYNKRISVSLVAPGTILDTKIRTKGTAQLLPIDNSPLDMSERKQYYAVLHEKSHYSPLYKKTKEMFSGFDEKQLGDRPDIVTKAVMMALSGKHPKPYYYVGHVGIMPAWLLKFVSSYVPVRVVDKFLIR